MREDLRADFLPGVFGSTEGLFFFAAAFFARAGRFAGIEGEDAETLAGSSAGGGIFGSSFFFATGFLSEFGKRIRGRKPVCKWISQGVAWRRAMGLRCGVRHFVFRWLVTTLAVMIASALLTGIRYDSWGSLIGAALLLGILNAFVRPILLLLSAPLILLTLGIFILIVNGLMLYWIPAFVPGFHIAGFGTAFWGAIIVSISSWLLSAFFRGTDGRVHVLTHHTAMRPVQGRVVASRKLED